MKPPPRLLLSLAQVTDGWTYHLTETCPVPPDTKVHFFVENELHDGKLPPKWNLEKNRGYFLAGDLRWDRYDGDDNIVAYRVVPKEDPNAIPERTFTLSAKQISEGWKYHTTDVMPVHRHSIVEYELRSTAKTSYLGKDARMARSLTWKVDGDPADIIAYRVVQDGSD